mgnify:CR=1 FL=1
MGHQLWIANTLRAHGLVVHEVSGWQTRGSAAFNPRGVVCHHTASHAGSDHPALGIVTNGRPDLAGPLCNVLLARNGDCWVVAAGRANHAGTGGWQGLTGNSSVLGIEAENNGVGEPWPAAQLDAYVRLCAALADGAGFSPATVCYHREWAPARKIDPAGPGIPSGAEWRSRVARALAAPPALTDEQKALLFVTAKAKAEQLPELGHGMARHPHRRAVAKLQQLLGITATGVYGPRTRAKVRAVQGFFGLPVTGVVDTDTWAWIIYAAFAKGRG